MDASELSQVELLFHTGRDILADSGQVTGLFAVQCGRQRQELVTLALAHNGMLLEELDGEGRSLFTDVSAQTRHDGGVVRIPSTSRSPFASMCRQAHLSRQELPPARRHDHAPCAAD